MLAGSIRIAAGGCCARRAVDRRGGQRHERCASNPSPYAGAPLEILPSEERDGSFPARGRIRFRNPHPKRGPSCPRPRQALWTLRALACRYRLGAQAQPLLLPDTINLPSKLATQRGGSRMRTNTIRMGLLACFAAAVAFGGSEALADQNASCGISVGTVNAIQAQLGHVINSPDGNGGLFKPNRMWSAIVDRTGKLCSVITSSPDAWPGSRAIAIAKAGTANDFSNNKLALSTANLYGPTQPGGSLYGLNNSNPFNPQFLPQNTGIGNVVGGIITFGGGVALYQGGQVIGGLGVSGDSSCADHAIAYRMRAAVNLNGTPGGVGSDNISYYTAGSPIDPSQFKQPHCGSSDITP
jgi:uncharacterized protein GlcG (DUF336 family)